MTTSASRRPRPCCTGCRVVPTPTSALTVSPNTPVWPDGNTTLHPTPFQFTSARTGANFDQPYERAAFEADLPAIEPTCNRTTGAGCTLIPLTDNGEPAQF